MTSILAVLVCALLGYILTSVCIAGLATLVLQTLYGMYAAGTAVLLFLIFGAVTTDINNHNEFKNRVMDTSYLGVESKAPELTDILGWNKNYPLSMAVDDAFSTDSKERARFVLASLRTAERFRPLTLEKRENIVKFIITTNIATKTNGGFFLSFLAHILIWGIMLLPPGFALVILRSYIGTRQSCNSLSEEMKKIKSESMSETELRQAFSDLNEKLLDIKKRIVNVEKIGRSGEGRAEEASI